MVWYLYPNFDRPDDLLNSISDTKDFHIDVSLVCVCVHLVLCGIMQRRPEYYKLLLLQLHKLWVPVDLICVVWVGDRVCTSVVE